MQDTNGNDAVSRALCGARYVALGALLAKVASVACTQAVLRLAPVEVLGVASAQLELLMNALLCVTRDGARLALTRGRCNELHARTLAWTSSFLGMALALSCSVLAHVTVAASTPYRARDALVLYCLAAGVDALSEPLESLARHHVLTAPRAVAEPAAALVRGAVAAGLLFYRPDLQAAALGWAQVAASIAAGLARVASWPTNLAMTPAFARKDLDQTLVRDALRFTGQAAVKHLATEADRFAVALLATPYEAGLYAFATHYGALVARLVLAPCEDACRLALAKCADERRAAQIGGAFAKGALYMGLICASIGAPFALTATRLLKGTHAPLQDIQACGAALAYFALQVPSLALNGISEACAHARADPRALSYLSVAHVGCAALFALLARPALASAGPPGLVAASGAVMALRALGAATLARRRAFPAAGGAFFAAAAPEPGVLLVLVGAGFIARRSAAAAPPLMHVAVTAGLGALCVVSIFVRDRAFVASLLGPAGRRAKAE